MTGTGFEGILSSPADRLGVVQNKARLLTHGACSETPQHTSEVVLNGFLIFKLCLMKLLGILSLQDIEVFHRKMGHLSTCSHITTAAPEGSCFIPDCPFWLVQGTQTGFVKGKPWLLLVGVSAYITGQIIERQEGSNLSGTHKNPPLGRIIKYDRSVSGGNDWNLLNIDLWVGVQQRMSREGNHSDWMELFEIHPDVMTGCNWRWYSLTGKDHASELLLRWPKQPQGNLSHLRGQAEEKGRITTLCFNYLGGRMGDGELRQLLSQWWSSFPWFNPTTVQWTAITSLFLQPFTHTYVAGMVCRILKKKNRSIRCSPDSFMVQFRQDNLSW